MSKHISIAIGARDLTALWIRKGVVRWHAYLELTDEHALDQALRTLLSSAPPAVRGAPLTAALSPRWVQTKQLHGLPRVSSPRLAAQLLRENEQAFFLWKGRPSVIVATFARDGSAWGAAYDSELLDALVRAAASERLRLARVVPSVTVLGAFFANQRVAWNDDEQRFEIRGSNDGLLGLRRLPPGETIELPPTPAALQSIGADAALYLPAYAASVLGPHLPLAWRPRAEPALQRRRARTLHTAGGVMLIGAAAATIVAPGIRAAQTARESNRELRELRVAQAEISSAQSELRRVTGGLDAVAGFVVDRGRVTRTLGALSQAIPESTAILDIRLDSVEGAFTAIAPNVADVLPSLADIREVIATQIVGSVTRELIAGVRLERAAFRFRRPRVVKTKPR